MYLNIEYHAGVPVVALRPGLFDQMRELGNDQPRVADVVAEVKAAQISPVAGVLLDLRKAGAVDSGVFALLVPWCRSLGGLDHIVFCGTPAFVEMWRTSLVDPVKPPAYVELHAALEAAAGKGPR
jgi:hypothetical protein